MSNDAWRDVWPGIWFLCAVGASIIADNKSRSVWGWFFAGTLLGPIALLIVALLPPSRTALVPMPALQTVLSPDATVRVVAGKLLVRDHSFDIRKLQPVEVLHPTNNWWRIYLRNLSGDLLQTLDSNDGEHIQSIADAINAAIAAHASTTAPAALQHRPVTRPKTALDAGGYDDYVDNRLGLRLCYPFGWAVHKDSDAESTTVRFDTPLDQAATIRDLYCIQVRVHHADDDFQLLSDEDLLRAASKVMARLGGSLVAPRIARIAGRRVIECAWADKSVVLGQTIEIHHWQANVVAKGRQVFLIVSGSAENTAEVEALFRTVLSTLQVLPVSTDAFAANTVAVTPTPAPASISCPPHFEQHLDRRHSFAVCYPTGWQKDEDTDKTNRVFWQFFRSPEKAFRRIAVSSGPGIQGFPLVPSDEVLLRLVSRSLEAHKAQRVAGPHIIVLSGHKAVEVGYEHRYDFPDNLPSLFAWSAFVPTTDRVFFVEVAGPAEQAQDIERLYREVIARFVILPIQ